MTSELDMPDGDVIDKYHGLARLEDAFRAIKTDLEGRPVFVSTKEHINAHFLTCFIALTMLRIIQYKILVHPGHVFKPSADFKLIAGAFGVDAELRIPSEHEVRQLKYRFDKSCLM